MRRFFIFLLASLLCGGAVAYYYYFHAPSGIERYLPPSALVIYATGGTVDAPKKKMYPPLPVGYGILTISTVAGGIAP